MSTTQPSINENLQQDGANKSKKGGLEGIVAATTALSKVEGTAGRLIYRGYNIHDLARTTSFEEIAHLLWFGHLPDKEELLDLKIRLLADHHAGRYVTHPQRAAGNNRTNGCFTHGNLCLGRYQYKGQANC